MTKISCPHEHALGYRKVCEHLLDRNDPYPTYGRRYTGKGLEYDLICLNCCFHPDQVEDCLVGVCQACFEKMEQQWDWEGPTVGRAQVPIRDIGLRLVHKITKVPLSAPLCDIQPVEAAEHNGWIGLTKAGDLIRLDLHDGSATLVARLANSQVDLEKEVSLDVSSDASWAAVVNTRGQHGTLLHLLTGQSVMSLDRGNYHPEASRFPVAFFKSGAHTLMVHATDWNRLDITDPETGTSVTKRTSPKYREGKGFDPHYLDYFHGRLAVSPDQDRIAEYGWMWHPVGQVVSWDLRRWLTNPWESEDGLSRIKGSWCDGYWDGPLCWVGNSMLATWGLGHYESSFPAVVLYDAVTGRELRWFPGPEGDLVFDEFLYSMSPTHGTAAWDVTSGDCLFRDPDFKPLRYNHYLRQFLTIMPDGSFLVSHVDRE